MRPLRLGVLGMIRFIVKPHKETPSQLPFYYGKVRVPFARDITNTPVGTFSQRFTITMPRDVAERDYPPGAVFQLERVPDECVV